MAKYLTKPCVDIRIKTITISRKEIDGQWQTYATVVGEALDEDGTVLELINKKFNVGSPGENDWDDVSFGADLIAIANIATTKYNNILINYTIP